MVNSLKKVFVYIFSVMVFAFAGLFLVGCNEDYSNVTITSNFEFIELEVGESQEVVFTINDAPSSFVRNLRFNVDVENVIARSEPSYNGDQVSLTVTALKGGTVTLTAVSEDGFKSAAMTVSVVQHSESLAFNDDLLYVSNSSPLVMSDGYYTFDPDTTDKDMSYYYVAEDISNMNFGGFTETGLEFIDTASTASFIYSGVQIDTIAFNEDGTGFVLSLNGVESGRIDSLVSYINIIAIYDYSENYSDYLYCIHQVSILPDIEVEFAGGYLAETDPVDMPFNIDFTEVEDDILLVPNSDGYTLNSYILRVVVASQSSLLEYSFTPSSSQIDINEIEVNDNLTDADYLQGKTVYYLQITSAVFANIEESVVVNIRYSNASEESDQSVNFFKTFNVSINVAPKTILVNGMEQEEFSSENNPLILYNTYNFPEFGWRDMQISVSSNTEVTPVYSYATIEFENDLRFRYGQIEISSLRQLTDLSTLLQFKGADGAEVTPENEVKNFTIHLYSDVLGEEHLTFIVYYRIIAGATSIVRDDGIGTSGIAYIDHVDTLSVGKDMSNYLYANAEFQYFTTSFTSGQDVVDFHVTDEYCEQVGTRYTLKFSVTSKAAVQGTYQFMLDNGTAISVTFSVIDTLKQDSSGVDISLGTNVGYSEKLKSNDELNYFDVLNLEILNPTVNEDGQYVINYGSVAEINFYGNISRIEQQRNDQNIVQSSAVSSLVYRIETLSNGSDTLNFEIFGNYVNDTCQVEEISLEFTVNVISYSLLSEFALLNGGEYAVDNIVYYGDSSFTPDESMSRVQFEILANNTSAYNFYQYSISSEFLEDNVLNAVIYNEINDIVLSDPASFSVGTEDVVSSLVAESFDQKFVYYYVDSSNLNYAFTTITTVSVSFMANNLVYQTDIELTFNNGFMFYADTYTLPSFIYDNNGEDLIVTNIAIEFSNYYYIESFGEFDLSNLTYIYSANTNIPMTIHAYVRQRDYGRTRYDANITPTQYVRVLDVSTAATVDELVFTNSELTQSFVVYVSPSTATNTTLNVQDFVPVNSTSSGLISCTATQQATGTYMIEVSAENFYNTHSNISEIEDTLGGTLYIYPTEWGESYSVIEEGNNPIIIDISYRNGSENNRYILETPEDVVRIGENKESLSSHYELKNLIDMSSATNFQSLGLISGDELVGFSGSIVGTTNQAGLTNVNISSVVESGRINPLVSDGTYYSGLFAKIEEDGYLKNISISGSIQFDDYLQNNHYIGLVAGNNEGTITNVGVRITRASTINISSTTSNSFYIGGVVGRNSGTIEQYFPAYSTNVDPDFSGHTSANYSGEFAGQTTKIPVYFNQKLTVMLNTYDGATNTPSVSVGGVAGYSSGVLSKTDDTSLNIYGYATYFAYSDIEIVSSATNTVNALIYAGGAVGYLASEPASQNDGDQSARIENLIVGGEVDSQVNTERNRNSYVGGIAGYAFIMSSDGVGAGMVTQNVYITGNTSRVFLRGEEYVGGILGGDGYDTYINHAGNSRVYFHPDSGASTTNSVEAVDDGRSVLDASMMILRTGSNDNVRDLDGDANLTDAENDARNNIIISIGNAYTDENDFGYLNNVNFNAYSYLDRSQSNLIDVLPNDTATNTYYGDFLVLNGTTIVQKFNFVYREVDLGLNSDSRFLLQSDDENANDYVYLMFYFEAEGYYSSNYDGQIAQDVIDNAELNFFNTSSSYYPFTLSTRDAEIVSNSSDILTVDVSGNLTTQGIGDARLRLQSILNVQKTINIYIHIINYFDIFTTESIFYDSNTTNGLNIINGSEINVYGSRQTSIYAVPTYENEDFNISEDGIIRVGNVSLILERNTAIVPDVEIVEGETPYTSSQISGQAISFFGRLDAIEGTNNYRLNNFIQVEVNNVLYYMQIGQHDVNLRVSYMETATDISITSQSFSMQIGDDFREKLSIESKNDEYAYYEITYINPNGGESVVQSKMDDTAWGEGRNFGTWQEYINNFDTEEDLFYIIFTKNGNEFDLDFSLNRTAYLNKKSEEIFGTYVIRFYANELRDGVSCTYTLTLNEAALNNLSVSSYSNINDTTVTDEVIVPSQYGLLEITVSPTEAEFDRIVVSNGAENYAEGAAEIAFTFAYQQNNNGVITYATDAAVGRMNNGVFTITYDEIMSALNNYTNSEEYSGRIYIRYIMPSSGVEDNMPVSINVRVDYMDELYLEENVMLQTKLANYVYLTFNDRVESDVYYLARGLSYGMTLDYYGFSLEDIEITISDENRAVMTGTNRDRTLTISSDELEDITGVGYQVTIDVYASRIVDNVLVEFSDSLTIYIMDYVFNYTYIEGVNEDIVDGMEEGVISTAIGNAYTLQLDIWDYMEYNASIPSVVENVQTFINSLTNGVTFSVTDNSTGGNTTELQQGLEIRSDYYRINGMVFTGIRLYEPRQDVYHLTVDGSYVMYNGRYYFDDGTIEGDSQRIYTVFNFSIHQQSTDESPLPIETYEDFIDMEDGEYYILLNDIYLPDSDSIDYEQFEPISANVAGFDGNGYTIYFAGDYNFSTSDVGVFTQIGTANDSSVVFRNVTIEVSSNTRFIMTASSFNVGLLTATNYAIVTNCEVRSANNSTLSVTYPTSVTTSMVAGLVATNSGIVTNSRSLLNLNANVNLSGFVGSNSGTISSSYFLNGSLQNRTNTTTEYTAGFVLQNTGEIYTSYVSGYEQQHGDANDVYYSGETNFINSDNNISGFAYHNNGLIENCYSNINLTDAGARSSGFVFNNSDEGIIRTSFSTSVLMSYNTLSYGFARESAGVIEDCFWLSDSNEGVNVSISTIDNTETISIQSLSLDEFDIDNENFEENFKNFIYVEGRNYNSVWFYNDANTSTTFNGRYFNINRLELVAPNIIAFSQRYMYDAVEVVDPDTGITTVTYYYANTDASGVSGSLTNPILIDSAEHFEEYILNENDANNFNSAYYRLINNIDYSEYTDNSEIFRTRFIGYLEGNNLSISNISLVSSENLTLAGMFAEVGSSSRSNSIGTMLNFNLEPTEIVFSNAQVVGAVAGRLDGGVIANVDLLSDDNIVVSGKNIVGGLVGVAIGEYRIENIYNELSAKASYIATDSSNQFNINSTVYQYYSYAGSVIGVASGRGGINRLNVDSSVAVIGAKAGGLIGLVDSNVVASRLYLTVTEELMINAYNYGGLILGESVGTVDEVEITEFDSNLGLSIFSTRPNIPTAVGGVIGLVRGGNLSNIIAGQDLNLSAVTTSDGVDYIGGLAGLVTGNTVIDNVNISSQIVGFNTVGGLIGGVRSSSGNIAVSITNSNYVDGYLSVLSSQNTTAYIGGFIGRVEGSVVLNIDADAFDETDDALIQPSYEDSAQDEDGVTWAQFKESVNSLEGDIHIDPDYVSRANKINFGVSVTTYMYNTSFDTYVGEIVGYMQNGLATVRNTISYMNGTVNNLNMGLTSYNEMTDNATISQSSFVHVVDDIEKIYNGASYISNDSGNIVRVQDLQGYQKGNWNIEIENRSVGTGDESQNIPYQVAVLPVYTFSLTYNYYAENNSVSSDSCRLHLNNIGVAVSSAFYTQNFATTV